MSEQPEISPMTPARLERATFGLGKKEDGLTTTHLPLQQESGAVSKKQSAHKGSTKKPGRYSYESLVLADQKAQRAAKESVVPGLPGAKWSDRLQLFCEPLDADSCNFEFGAAIYFVVRDGHVIYIGQSARPEARCSVAVARFGGALKFYALRMPEWAGNFSGTHRLEMESAFIEVFKPPANRKRPQVKQWARNIARALTSDLAGLDSYDFARGP